MWGKCYFINLDMNFFMPIKQALPRCQIPLPFGCQPGFRDENSAAGPIAHIAFMSLIYIIF
jgi:hypothetical protein